MRVYLGCDHAGFELKQELLGWLAGHGHEPVDCGAFQYDPDDDYPPFVLQAAARTAADPDALGVVIGGSGNGEAIAANKVVGVRAALVWNERIARLAREHNDANVISLGARQHSIAEAIELVRVFLATPFSGDPRHRRRIAMIGDYERDRVVPGGS
ncbi:MAG: ribose-5-phosphate isomerase [Sporichthyaceae bacterium]|nr:ribose-5-phosphate isomerase [Sporichthyaceae bacterium]